MNRALLIAGWLVVTGVAYFLRFEKLETRPMHFDEATGARVTASRMENDGGKFDPKHGHGPMLWNLAATACRIRGEDGWKTMREATLRSVPALAGLLVVLLPLWWRRTFGDGTSLLMAGFLATCPLLVYYSRMFIHEMLLVLCGMAAITALVRGPRWIAAGICTGLMTATKETAAISVIAWVSAAPLAAARRDEIVGWIRAQWRRVAAAVVTALLVAALLYTDGLRHPRGALDMILTFFLYETVPGHDKPATWYLTSLLWPSSWNGAGWIHALLIASAVAGCALAWRPQCATSRNARIIRWLGGATAIHFLIYSVIAYKTPWLACLPWAMLCVLAASAWAWIPKTRAIARATAAALAVAIIGASFTESRRACGRRSGDPRNPYAYVPTRADVVGLADWFEKLRASANPGTMDAAAVIGSGYWPLPWYLRSFATTGYFTEADVGWEGFPVVIAMPDAMEAASAKLAATHVSLPRGLRDGVPMMVFVENELWRQWTENH